jgi:hypothetical protein
MIPHHKTLRHYRIPTVAWAFVLMWSYVYVVRIIFKDLHALNMESLVAVFGFLTQAVISTRDILKDLRTPMDDET